MFSVTWFEDNPADGGLVFAELVGGGGGGLHCYASVLAFRAVVKVAGINCGNAMICEKVEVFLALILRDGDMTVFLFDVSHKERMVAEDDLDGIFACICEGLLQPLVLFGLCRIVMHDEAGIKAYNTYIFIHIDESILPVAGCERSVVHLAFRYQNIMITRKMLNFS